MSEVTIRQSKCGCWQSQKPCRRIWFAKPFSYYTRWSPVWLGGDQWCRRTLVLGWGFTGLIIIAMRECRGCEDCGPTTLDGRGYPHPLTTSNEVAAALEVERESQRQWDLTHPESAS